MHALLWKSEIFFFLKGRPHHSASNGQIMDWHPPPYCLVRVQLFLGILCPSTFLPSMHALFQNSVLCSSCSRAGAFRHELACLAADGILAHASEELIRSTPYQGGLMFSTLIPPVRYRLHGRSIRTTSHNLTVVCSQ